MPVPCADTLQLVEEVHVPVTGDHGRTVTLEDMLSAEAEYVLHTIEERGIRFVRLWFTDVLGFLKSFTIT
jgi:hypothetical protein